MFSVAGPRRLTPAVGQSPLRTGGVPRLRNHRPQKAAYTLFVSRCELRLTSSQFAKILFPSLLLVDVVPPGAAKWLQRICMTHAHHLKEETLGVLGRTPAGAVRA